MAKVLLIVGGGIAAYKSLELVRLLKKAGHEVTPVLTKGGEHFVTAMSLGTLAMVGSLGPRNLIHLVFDNEIYGSTGGQRSPSREVRLDRLARSAGYRTAIAATTPDEIAVALRSARVDGGPHFILVKVTATETPAPRIPHTPHTIRDRFRRIATAG